MWNEGKEEEIKRADRESERETGGEKTTGNQPILKLFLQISSHNTTECRVQAGKQSHYVFSHLISLSYTGNVKGVEVEKVTSALPQASSRVVCQGASGCRHLGAVCWDFCAAAFWPAISILFLRSYGSAPVLSRNFLFQSSGLLTGAHMKNKGNKQKTKKKGNENVFGCDLIEHLQGSGQDGNSCFRISLHCTIRTY